MEKQPKPLLNYMLTWTLTFVTLMGGILFYSGIPWNRWFFMLVFIALTLYPHFASIQLPHEMNYSLFTSTIFPVIYLFGSTPAVLIAAVAGLGDGMLNKKKFAITLFNTSQLAFSTLVGSLVFQSIREMKTGLWYHDALALCLGAFVYTCINYLLVALMLSMFSETKRRIPLFLAVREVFLCSLGTSFVGLIFALFVDAYSVVGLLAFGIFLVYLSRLLVATIELSDEKIKRKKLEEELLIDDMTQAHNFRFLNNWLGNPRSVNFAVLFIDIDDFKVFNDYYGHAEGDEVLRTLTRTIKGSIRSTDRLIRYGGDEFVVLLPNQTKKNALKVADRIKNNLAELPYASKKHPITVSVGVAAAPYDTEDKHQLLMLADQAMYLGKKKGKNCIQPWTTSNM